MSAKDKARVFENIAHELAADEPKIKIDDLIADAKAEVTDPDANVDDIC
jgi:hypothetical protein